MTLTLARISIHSSIRQKLGVVEKSNITKLILTRQCNRAVRQTCRIIIFLCHPSRATARIRAARLTVPFFAICTSAKEDVEGFSISKIQIRDYSSNSNFQISKATAQVMLLARTLDFHFNNQNRSVIDSKRNNG